MEINKKTIITKQNNYDNNKNMMMVMVKERKREGKIKNNKDMGNKDSKCWELTFE